MHRGWYRDGRGMIEVAQRNGTIFQISTENNGNTADVTLRRRNSRWREERKHR